MNNGARLFFLFFLVASFFACPLQGVAADVKKKGVDMASELREKTFSVVEDSRDRKSKKKYYAYFKKNGSVAIKFSAKHSKGGKWQVDDKSILCMTTLRHKSNKTSIRETKCGKLVKKSDRFYRWYDGKAKPRAAFSLTGKGNRLP